MFIIPISNTGNVQNVKNANIAVFTCPFDMLATETKGTVLLKNAKELKDFSKGEENLMEAVSYTINITTFETIFYWDVNNKRS